MILFKKKKTNEERKKKKKHPGSILEKERKNKRTDLEFEPLITFVEVNPIII